MITLLAVILLAASQAEADSCQKKVYLEGNAKVSVSEDCLVTIDPQETNTLNRNYSIDSDGYFMVFIDDQNGIASNNLGSNSKTTGSRTFHLLPARKTKPQVVTNADGKVEVLTASGAHFLLGKNGEVEAINGRAVQVKSLKDIDQASRENGGFEIPSVLGVLADYGWGRGKETKTNFAASAQLRDKDGKVCVVKNSEVFKKGSNPNNPVSKYDTSAGWRGFLAARCKNLRWSDEVYKTSLEGSVPALDPAFEAYERARSGR